MFPEQFPEETGGGELSLEQGTPQMSAPAEKNLSIQRESAALSPELERLHEESLLKYPSLPIHHGEYVVLALRRNTVGLLAVWFVIGLLIVLTLAILPIYSLNHDTIAATVGVNASSLLSPVVLAVPLLFIDFLFILGGLIASNVYSQNRLYLTNENIINYKKTGLFSTQLQHLNLINIDDVSSKQQGILQHVLHYGTITISTSSEDTIYVFEYANNPERIVRIITDATENATGTAAHSWGRQAEQANKKLDDRN
jgi:hypothetical protein